MTSDRQDDLNLEIDVHSQFLAAAPLSPPRRVARLHFSTNKESHRCQHLVRCVARSAREPRALRSGFPTFDDLLRGVCCCRSQRRWIMQIPIVIESLPGNRFRAKSTTALPLMVEANSAEESLRL